MNNCDDIEDYDRGRYLAGKRLRSSWPCDGFEINVASSSAEVARARGRCRAGETSQFEWSQSRRFSALLGDAFRGVDRRRGRGVPS